MMTTLTWLIRYGHVLSAALWTGGYALLAFVIVPLTERGTNDALGHLAVATVCLGSYAGTLTIGFGLVLISRTRGLDSLLSGEWGGMVLTCIAMAVALLGIGDRAHRPALVRLAAGEPARDAPRLAFVGLALTVLAIGLMTRAVYAPT